MATKTGRPEGRPPAYRKEWCKTIIDLGKQGKTVTQWAAALGVGKSTIHQAAAQHDEFADAMALANAHAEAWWTELGQKQAISPSGQYNFAPVKFILSAAFGMRETTGVDATISYKTPVPDFGLRKDEDDG